MEMLGHVLAKSYHRNDQRDDKEYVVNYDAQPNGQSEQQHYCRCIQKLEFFHNASFFDESVVLLFPAR